MRIGELSRQTGVNPRVIRHYEEQGLIRSNRTASRLRLYTDADLQRLRIISKLRSLEFSLEEIRQVLPRFREGRFQGRPQDVYALLERQLSRVRAKGAALREVENWLKQLQERISQEPGEAPSLDERAGGETSIGPQRSSRKGRLIALIDGCCDPFCGPLTCGQPVDNQGSKK
jgi:DNA-binding transcriptional MerR regulator